MSKRVDNGFQLKVTIVVDELVSVKIIDVIINKKNLLMVALLEDGEELVIARHGKLNENAFHTSLSTTNAL